MKSFKAGHYIQQGYYKSFQPTPIHRAWSLDNMEIINLLSQADRALGQLDMYSNYIPNINMFIEMHVLKEATQSSKIEGTQTNMAEALMEKSDLPLDKRDDWDEVQNYIQAMQAAIPLLDDLPFSSRLIREIHKILLQGVRGEHKNPGEFRNSQNWIGGASLKDAIFIPPAPHTVAELMSDLEKFVHDETFFVPELIKIAIIHYQFETIHPFLDGNGRVGRLMITLYLVAKGILKKPVLYLSDFLERNRQHYYDNLMRGREKNDLTQWIKFFLVGIVETSQKGIQTFDAVLSLQRKVDAQIQKISSRNLNAQKLMQLLYQKPVINAEKAKDFLKISTPTSYKLLKELAEMGILKEITGTSRHRLYAFDEYIQLFS
jgi:Fic family protein